MGLSISHLIIIFLILMLLFGASRLEGLGSSLGKAIRGFKKGLDGEDDEKSETKKLSSSTKENPDDSKA